MHHYWLRVYYEDTDLAGVVYYANYLRFIERARTEFLRSHGIDQLELRRRFGVVFAVTRIEATYRRPAHFDDYLTVSTRIHRLSGARLALAQGVARGDETLFHAEVELACVGVDGKPKRLPPIVTDSPLSGFVTPRSGVVQEQGTREGGVRAE